MENKGSFGYYSIIGNYYQQGGITLAQILNIHENRTDNDGADYW